MECSRKFKSQLSIKKIKEDKVINITKEKICRVLGIDISEDDIICIFKSLGFCVNKKDDILEMLDDEYCYRIKSFMELYKANH